MTSAAEPISTLTFHAIPAEELRRIRAAGADDFGHPFRITLTDTAGGTPLRCCLREAEIGERVALIAWRPLAEAPDSVYAEVGPIFVHADECVGYLDDRAYPEGFRHRTQVLRSYTATGDMHATMITDGSTAETSISALLADPDAVVVHSRNVRAGCYMFAIRRR
jgi:hypothetical protein